MPYPFTLPTTSATALTTYFSSSTHPSLLLTATSQRALLRDVLKRHKRLPTSAQSTNISVVQDALNSYLPYLLSIYTSSPDADGATSYGGQAQVAITELQELVTEWRTTLISTLPGREPPRPKVKGLRNELAFVLTTLAYTYTLLARNALLQLSHTTSPSSEVRAALLTTAMKHLLTAQSIHLYTSKLPVSSSTPCPTDITPSTSTALASLALAEATRSVTLKDDPYAAAVNDVRDEDSKSWMISAPHIPKTRANLYARICLAAAEHAGRAAGGLSKAFGLDEGLGRYVEDLRRTSRGKAARWFAVASEEEGKTGEAIAWLRGAKQEMGVQVESKGPGKKGWKGLRREWAEKREDKKVERGKEDWGLDAGRWEEVRVVEWLEAKWVKANDTINVQVVPPFAPLLAQMPSGREYHTPGPYTPPSLSPEILNSMKTQVDPDEPMFTGHEDDSGDEQASIQQPVGAFPGTSGQYSGTGNSYY